ncbi:MAG: IS66 family transposase [Sphaerochaeta sp.]
MSNQSIEELQAQIKALQMALKASESMRKSEEMRHKKAERAMGEEIQRYVGELQHYAKEVQTYTEEIQHYTEELQRYKDIIERLKENFDIARYLQYASVSEKRRGGKNLKKLKEALEETKVDTADCSDLDLGPSVELEEKKEKKRWGRVEGVKTSGRNMEFCSSLEKETIEYDIKAQTLISELVFVKKQVRNQVSYVPSHLRCREIVTYIYKNKSSGKLVYATPDEHDIIKGGKLTNGFIAASIADRIIWGLPFYRQSRRINLMAGSTIVNAQLLTRSFLSVSGFLQGLGDELYRQVTSSNALHGDETSCLVIHDDESGSRKQGYLWMLSSNGKHPVSYCRFYPSRSSECAKELLSPCKSVALQVDGYVAYASVVKDMNAVFAKEIEASEGKEEAERFLQDSKELLQKGILLVGCMAHARRRFYQVFEAIYKKKEASEGYKTCTTVLDLIAQLYRIEDTLRLREDLSEEEFLMARKKEAIPVLRTLRSYVREREHLHTAEAKLSEAIRYLLNQIDTIANYLESADLTPDNNAQERLIKTICTSRKNSLFASTEEGARAWALMHSILQTAMINGVEPTAYLKMILDKVAKANHEEILSKDMDWERLILTFGLDKSIIR